MTANVPATVVAGDSWSWTSAFADNPAPTWVVTFYFQTASNSFSIICVASGSNHAASKPASETATLVAGRYKWRARAVSGSQAFTLAEGWIEVEPDPAATKIVDPRSPARVMLEAVEATLLGRATDGQLEMSIANRTIRRIPIPELLQLRDRLREEVRIEELGSKVGAGRYLKTRFSRG